MPKDHVSTEDVLKELSAAVAPLAKSLDELIAEATTLHKEAINYDKLYLEAIAKAEMDADGDYDGDTKKPVTKVGKEVAGDVAKAFPSDKKAPPFKAKDGKAAAADETAEGETGDAPDEECDDAAKADEVLEIAKAAHDLVSAYIETAEGDDKSPWAAFAKGVKDYHATVNQTLADKLSAWQKKAEATKTTLTKADDKAKAGLTAKIEAMDAVAKSLGTAADLAKNYADKSVFPRPEIKLDPPMSLEKGYMTIVDKASLMSCIEECKNTDLDNPPAVYAHIFNAAKALNVSLPVGWHAPADAQGITGSKSNGTGSYQTSRVSSISEADKSAAMAKGVTIVGPTGTLLAMLSAIQNSTLIERMTAADPKSEKVKALTKFLDEGTVLLKDIVGHEALAIRILDIPTFPEEVLKADHWATAAASAATSLIDTNTPVEDRTMIKELSARLVAAAPLFIEKSQTTDGLTKAEKDELAKAIKERDELKAKLEKFSTDLIPLTRAAQEKSKLLKAAGEDLAKANARIRELEAQPMPSKGRVGAAGQIEKSDDGTEKPGGDSETGITSLTKVDALPPGQRARGLLELAHHFRASEDPTA